MARAEEAEREVELGGEKGKGVEGKGLAEETEAGEGMGVVARKRPSFRD